MKSLLRVAAIAVASTALVAGMATSATAAPGDGVTGNVAVQPAATSGYTNSTTSFVPVAITPTTPGTEITSLRATVLVNGAAVANDVFVTPGTGFTYQRAWGIGSVSLTNIVASGYDSRSGTRSYFYGKPLAPSAAGQVRYGVDYKSKIRVNKRGKKLTFRLTARYINNANKPVGIRKATIQVKKGGKWKTLKNVKLKSNGTGKYKRSDKKKRQYRMVIKTTSTYMGGNTKGSIKL